MTWRASGVMPKKMRSVDRVESAQKVESALRSAP